MFQLLLLCLVFSSFGHSQSTSSTSPAPHVTPPVLPTSAVTPTKPPPPHKNVTSTVPVTPSAVPITSPVTTKKAIPETSATTQAPTSSNISQLTSVTPVETEAPKPITLTLEPHVRQIEEDSHTKMTCTISGTNLPKIEPYKLCWYAQGDGGKTNMISHSLNAHTIVLNKTLLHKYREHAVYCAVVFYQKTSRYFWMIKSHYFKIKAAKSKNGSIRQLAPETMRVSTPGVPKHATEHKSSDDVQSHDYLVIVSITGVVGALLLGLMAGFLVKRFRKPKTRTAHISEEPSMTSQDNVYSYVPLQTLSFYEAKALAASNTPKSMESVGPPPLPQRPYQERTINEEEEYIYSYAYGVRPPQNYVL